jgi:hypothetical protein
VKGKKGDGELVSDAIARAAETLETGQSFEPFVIVERDGLRDVVRFRRDQLAGARTAVAEFADSATGSDRCGLVHEGRVGMDEEAIVVEVQDGGKGDVEVFIQRFRPNLGLFRGFKLIGGPTSAGRREAVA